VPEEETDADNDGGRDTKRNAIGVDDRSRNKPKQNDQTWGDKKDDDEQKADYAATATATTPRLSMDAEQLDIVRMAGWTGRTL